MAAASAAASARSTAALGHGEAAAGAREQRLGVGDPAGCGLEHSGLGRQRRRGRGADGCVLAAQQLLSLGRPRQQLGVEHQPVGGQLVPQPGGGDAGADLVEHGVLFGVVVRSMMTRGAGALRR